MNSSLKTLTPFVPILAAILFGLTYAVYGRLLQTISIQTLFVGAALFNIVTGIAVCFLFPAQVNIGNLFGPSVVWFMLLAMITGFLGWLCTLWAIGNISATYAAIGEISYPLFTALFAYLIFHDRQLDWKMAVGGLLIAAGSYIIISDKIKIGE